MELARPVVALTPDEENRVRVVKDASSSVVFVTNMALQRDVFMDETAVPTGAGSGFIWDREGHIVTNFHVVANGDSFLVTLKDHTELPAVVVGVEPRKDIAVLKIQAPAEKLRALPLGDSQSLQVGQDTLAIGNPFGLDNTMTRGVVSALGRQVMGISGVNIRDMIQTDAAINPGNSGGPLLDSSGRLIGMNTIIYSGSGSSAGIGFAVPVTFIRRIVPQIIKFGKAIQPGLGVYFLTEEQKYSLVGEVDGVVVREVPPNIPAAKAGLRGLRRNRDGQLLLGDVIYAIDESPIRDFNDLYGVLDLHKVGDTVSVRILREGRKASLRVPLINVY